MATAKEKLKSKKKTIGGDIMGKSKSGGTLKKNTGKGVTKRKY